MALATMIEKLNAAKKAYEDQLASIGKDAQKAVAEFLVPHMPAGFALFWTQYTPYFNDGETCTFSVHDVYLVATDKLEECRNRSSGEEFGFSFSTAKKRYGRPDETKSYETDDYSKPLPRKTAGFGYESQRYEKKKVEYVEPGFPAIEGYDVAKLDELSKAWHALPEDLMENAFGDHVRCSISADGTVAVNEYDHD